MPKTDQRNFDFKNVQAGRFAPIAGFFNLESIIETVVSSSQENAETKALEVHKPCSYALLFVVLDQEKLFFFDIKSGPIVMKDFVKTLERIAKDVMQQHKNFCAEVTTPKQDAALCWICDTELCTF